VGRSPEFDSQCRKPGKGKRKGKGKGKVVPVLFFKLSTVPLRRILGMDI
jgi:hypothetical protein